MHNNPFATGGSTIIQGNVGNGATTQSGNCKSEGGKGDLNVKADLTPSVPGLGLMNLQYYNEQDLQNLFGNFEVIPVILL